MDLEYFASFLNEDTTEDDFLESIKTEVTEYVFQQADNQQVLNLEISNPDFDFILDDKNMVLLLRMYLSKRLLEWDLDYIFNVLDISVDTSDKSAEVLFNLSNPEINFPINEFNAQSAIEFLEGRIVQVEFSSEQKANYSSVFLDSCESDSKTL